MIREQTQIAESYHNWRRNLKFGMEDFVLVKIRMP